MAKKKTEDSNRLRVEETPAQTTRRRTTARRNSGTAMDAPPAELAASAAHATNGGYTPTYDEIAEAAYLRYLQRGGFHGRDFDDWVEAERELRSRR